MVADYTKKRVQVFTLDGTFVRAIQCDSRVFGVAVDNNGNIHAPLSNGNKVQVYGSHGEKLHHYSNTAGNFYYPRCIAIDDNGYRYVTTSSRLHILDDKGNQVNVIGGFNDIHGVALDKEGHIYVANYSGNTVIKY